MVFEAAGLDFINPASDTALSTAVRSASAPVAEARELALARGPRPWSLRTGLVELLLDFAATLAAGTDTATLALPLLAE